MQPSFAALGPALKVLLVWPRFPRSFWGSEGILEMLQEEASVPPLGLITVPALCPPSWTLRLLDHAFDEITDEDYKWADLVMVSAIYAQQADARAVLARARELAQEPSSVVRGRAANGYWTPAKRNEFRSERAGVRKRSSRPHAGEQAQNSELRDVVRQSGGQCGECEKYDAADEGAAPTEAVAQ